MRYQEIINDICHGLYQDPPKGEVASYIPELAKVSPDHFGVAMVTQTGDYFASGDAEQRFSIQSIAKVLSLTLAYQHLDGKLWKRVGVEPSGTPFNSLVQLEREEGIPRNPFINAGAIVVCDVLIGLLKDPVNDLLKFVRSLSGNETINYNPVVAASERSEGYRNLALTNFIRSFGNIHNDLDDVLDLYFNLCSLEMNCQELAETFFFLANDGVTRAGKRILTRSQTKRINAIMLTCGFYDEAGDFAYRVGLPGKSGVGGGIVAIHPEEYVIAVWSPPLNPKGNSARGVAFLEAFTTLTASSIF
jgi:glutaminase